MLGRQQSSGVSAASLKPNCRRTEVFVVFQIQQRESDDAGHDDEEDGDEDEEDSNISSSSNMVSSYSESGLVP